MKVGLILNKEVRNLPDMKNNYKVKRNKLKIKNREIEQELLFKKCQNFFKEINIKKEHNINNNLFPNPKNIFPQKLKTTIALPLISIPNLEFVNINLNKKNEQINNSVRNNKVSYSSTNIIKINQKKKMCLKIESTIKKKKIKNIFSERINKRLRMYEKTINKLKKPLFMTKFEYDENTNNINVIS